MSNVDAANHGRRVESFATRQNHPSDSSSSQNEKTLIENISSSDPEDQQPVDKNPPPPQKKELAAAEKRLVLRSKLVMYLVLAAAAGLVATLTYILTRSEEKRQLESDFDSYARDIFETSRNNALNTIEALKAFSTGITSYTKSFNATWPFVTIPDFEERASIVRSQSGASEVLFIPLVQEDQKQAFEEYSFENLHLWYEESQEAAGTSYPYNFSYPYIWGYQEPFSTSNYAWPVWQASPVWTPALQVWINCDLNTFPPSIRTIGNPVSYIAHPIYESFNKNATIVAFLSAALPWDSYFRNLLPDGVPELFVVLHDYCGNTSYSYAINGRDVEYSGRADELSSTLSKSQIFNPLNVTNATKGVTTCTYTIEVRASDAFNAKYDSTKPARYTALVLMVFLFTTLVFAIYDCFVRRMEKKVVTTAERTSAIVSSLFPENVQDRILEQAEEKMRNEKRATVKGQMNEFLAGSNKDSETTSKLIGSRPIADLFTATTIMFADIVGFTAWSSTRDPSQVFTLLETLFQRFDDIARRLHVFKVETVGDCYVAVVGLPEPREKHAIVMARFAMECLDFFPIMATELESILGAGTADLGLRVGLHSGPTTAGVLRGERARFQLFGDTVNMASRMESTGEKNRIQVSRDTTDLLIKEGKGHWVREREEKIFVKGKGETQTFWLLTINETVTSESHSWNVATEASYPPTDTNTVKEDGPPLCEQEHVAVHFYPYEYDRNN